MGVYRQAQYACIQVTSTVIPMIGYIKGTAISDKIVDVNGIGYLVHTPTPLTPGDEVALHVSTQVREDSITLYGFLTDGDKTVFSELMKVNGVGPTSALQLIKYLTGPGVVNAVISKNIKVLTSVKGVGEKVATKIVTLYKASGSLTVSPRVQEIVEALVGLGWDRAVSVSSAEKALATNPDGTEEDLVSSAIKLAQGGGK